jgi:hypothetical protein
MVNPQFVDVENLNTKVLSRNCFQAPENPLFTPIVTPISTPIPDNGGYFLAAADIESLRQARKRLPCFGEVVLPNPFYQR